MNDQFFQLIYNELAQYLVLGWEKLIVYLEYGEGYYSISFYEKVNGRYYKCYDLSDVSEDDLDQSFERIDKAVSIDRGKEKDPWSNMTMIVDNTGKMHVDFDYTDLSNGAYKYIKQWKKNYLV